MLRITESKNAEAAKQYFGKGMVRSDYYIDGQEIAGKWGGKTAERLGLTGQVTQPDYFAVVDNFHPRTAEQLTPRQKDNRRAGYDFTFSAPKSVSVMYELSGDERILSAFREAVKETMEEIEREMKARVRKGGKDENRLTANMLWAEFIHFTSRPVDGIPDPHLHAHCFAPNVTWDDKEGRYKAGQFGELKRDATYFEAAFDARLAKWLGELGYATQKAKYSFEIAGMPKSVIDKFSRRRNEIEAEAAAKGIESPEGKHAIGYYGRENKKKDAGTGELRVRWTARLTPTEKAAVERLAFGNNGRSDGDGPISAKDAMRHAMEHCFERVSVTSDKRLQAEALRFAVGSVLPDQVRNAAQTSEIIRREVNGETVVTTRAVRLEELQMLRFARDGKGRFDRLGNGSALLPGLSSEQRKAALHVLGSLDAVVGIRGAAGTGKTHMMKATIAAIENASAEPGGDYRKVFVFAPSAQASRKVLREEGFASADTVAQLLNNEEMQSKVKGQVLWIDEAGLMSSKDMRRVFQLAEKQNCRLILSGDYRQHSAVQRGDALRILESESGVEFAELKEIRRQKESLYRKAVEAISKGTAKDAAKGFAELEKNGAIIEADGKERHALLIKDYLQAATDGKSALVIAPTHAEGRALSSGIRAALKDAGELGQKEHLIVSRVATNWTDAERADARNYQSGQIVQFHQAVAGERKRKGKARGTFGGYEKGEAAVVLRQVMGNVVILRKDGSEALLPLDKAERFNVYNAREIAIAEREKIRITANGYATVNGPFGPKRKRIHNGDIHSVQSVADNGDLHLSSGAVLPRTFGHVTHGYVDTSHASQGKTVDRVFIAVGDESLPAANRAQWYVSVSRAREQVRVYTDDAQALKEAVQKSPERLSVSEMMRGKKKREKLDMRRISRFLKDRLENPYDAIRERSTWQERIQHERRGHHL